MSTAGGNPAPPRADALAGWTAGVSAAVTVAVVVLPFLGFAYRAPALHIALETANALIALLVGYLVYGRYRQHRRLQELLLVLALVTVAIANLLLTAVPTALTIGSDAEFSRWAAVAIRFLGTALLAGAALAPVGARLARGRTLLAVIVLAGVVTTAAAVGFIWGGHLPPTVDPAARLGDASRPQLTAHPLVLAAQALGVLLYSVAAVAFTRQSTRRGDELLRWVGAACVLAAAARVHYLLFPSLYSAYVYSGDLLRLGFYVLLLVGAGREIQGYWEARARAAVLEDRRRMARDLHDGLTQELAYIGVQARQLAGRSADAVAVQRIAGAADRATDEARRAIAALTQPLDEPFPRILQRVVEEAAERYEVGAVTEVAPAAEVTPEQGEAVLRITAEAIRNAARHGGAPRVEVALAADPLRLTVVDDGSGFDPATIRAGGFGLTSMRERATAAGGRLSIMSARGRGTTVEVVWP